MRPTRLGGRPRNALLLAAATLLACATPPRPTPRSIELADNPRAFLSGTVRDSEGRPVEGIEVHALPRAKDVGWSPPGRTDARGRFALTVFAPAEYGFLLRHNGITVVTPDPSDPSRVRVAVTPGQSREGAELVFLRELWDPIRGRGPLPPGGAEHGLP